MNIKIDLINELNNQKYYTELELRRITSQQNLDYKKKLDTLSKLLGKIVLYNQKIALAENIFVASPENKEQSPTQNIPEPPKGNAIAGQSHAE